MGFSMGGIGAAVGGGGMMGLGSALSMGEGLIERNWAKRDAERDRTFEREMVGRQEAFQERQSTTAFERSNTAYQRSMADMKAAGLNPMLAYSQGGAKTPNPMSGAKGSAPGTKPTRLDITGGMARGAQATLNTAQLEVTQADVRMKNSVTDLNSAKALQVAEQTTKTVAETKGVLTDNQIRNLKQMQRNTTGDSILGRWITTIFRVGKVSFGALKRLADASSKMGKEDAKRAKTLLQRLNYGKINNKKTIRPKYTRRYGGPR